MVGDVPFQIAWGVGEIRLRTAERVDVIRSWAESIGGALVLVDGQSEHDPWGTPPSSLSLQRRLMHHLDPTGVINRGRLPGRS